MLLLVLHKKYGILLSKRDKINSTSLVSNNCKFKLLSIERKRKQVLFWAYFILLFFLGLRGYVYTDFVNYKPFFDMLDGFGGISEVLLIKGWEPGYVLYATLCKMIIPNYFAWNFISTLIDLLLLYFVLERYSSNHILSLLIFFVIGSTALEFNVLRNAKAIFLFLFSLRYIEERKMWKYFAIIILACFFHISSILYFPLYFFLHKSWSKLALIIILICGAIFMFLHIGVISDIVSRISFADESRLDYLANQLDDTYAYTSVFGNIERFLTMLLVILLYDKIAKGKPQYYLFLNMYVLLYMSFTICSESATMVQRFQYMFIASFWILYPLLIEYAKKHRASIIYLFIIGLLSLKLILMAGDPNLEYENVLTGVSNYESKSNAVQKNLGQ